MDETKDAFPLGVEIKRTNKAIKLYIDRYLEAHLKESLTGVEGMTLGYIFHHQTDEKGNPRTITAKDVMLNSKNVKATTSQTLTSLQRKGFIKMVPLKEDQRVKSIVLTEKGREVNKEFNVIFGEINSQISKGITQQEKDSLRAILKKVQANVDYDESEE
jgi:MarR family transcriptional regulator, repressor for mepA